MLFTSTPCVPKKRRTTALSVSLPAPCIRLMSAMTVSARSPGFWQHHANHIIKYLNLALSRRQIIRQMCLSSRRCLP